MKGGASSSSSEEAAAADHRAEHSEYARADHLPVRRSHVLVLLRVREMPLPKAEDWR